MESAEVLGPISPSCTSLLNQENVDSDVRVIVDTMTGGRFIVSVSSFLQIYSFKSLLAKKLNVSPDKICLLHKDCVLSSGTLLENGLRDYSTVRVFVSMETGTKENASCGKKVGANNEAAANIDMNQDFFKSVEAKQLEDFLAGTVALTVAVKTEHHTLLIQLKINSATTGQSAPCPKGAGKSGTVVDRLEQIAPGVVQGAFSGTIPICSSPQSGTSFVPMDTVTDIVRDLVTFSAKAIGVPEVANSIANNADQCISCCGFSAPTVENAIENVNPAACPFVQQPAFFSHAEAAPGNSNSQNSKKGVDDTSLRKVVAGKAKKNSSRLSTSDRHRHGQDHRRRSKNSRKNRTSRRSSTDKYNEVTRLKMSLLRAMLSK